MNSCMALSEDESSTTNRDYGYSDFAKAFLAVHIPTMYLDYRIEAYDLFYCIDHEYAYVHSGSDEVEHETQIRTCRRRATKCREGNSGTVSVRHKLQTIMNVVRSSQNKNQKGEAHKIGAYSRIIHNFFIWLSIQHPDAWQVVKLVEPGSTNVRCYHVLMSRVRYGGLDHQFCTKLEILRLIADR